VTLERLFLSHLDVLDDAVRFIARRHLLSTEETEELASSVRLKIIEHDYDVLRKFEGRSSLRTYLTAIVHRHFLDARIARWGKWRPCVLARQFGPVGLLLDRYMSRDGLTADEAVEQVRSHPDVTLSVEALRAMADALPVRTPRRFVSDTALDDLPATVSPPGTDSVDQSRAALTDRALSEALKALPAPDQHVLRLRFQHGLQVAQSARLMGLDQKALYRRIEALLKRLRRELETRGVNAADVGPLIGHPEAVFNAFAAERPETAPARTSLQ
jgi:RNA polymerase sigma factor (sigma-70 family)